MMASSNDNLGRKEALLLLYLADELPLADRTQVDEMLATDASAREMFEELRASREQVAAGMARLDELQPLPAQPTLIRNITRVMQQWQVDRAVRPTVAEPAVVSRFGWRTYSVAAAAVAAIVVAVVWWVNQAEPTAPGLASNSGASDPFGGAISIRQMARESDLALDKSFGTDSLDDAEREMAGLRFLNGDIQ
jgi:anti-sigma factor RsiW